MYFVSGKEKKQGSSPLALDRAVQQRVDDAAEEWAAPFLRGRLLAARHPIQAPRVPQPAGLLQLT
jgi:hypothetical protein